MGGRPQDKGLCRVILAFLMNAVLVGGVSSGASAAKRLSAPLSVCASDPLTQWVIAPAKGRRLPPQIPTASAQAPIKLAQNLQIDGSLLSGVAGLTEAQIQALGGHTSPPPRWAPCHAGLDSEKHTFTLGYPDARTALSEAARRDLSAFAAQEGLFTLHSELEGLGARTQAVARRRAHHIEARLVRSGVASEHIQVEWVTRDRCERACANRVVITQRPFK